MLLNSANTSKLAKAKRILKVPSTKFYHLKKDTADLATLSKALPRRRISQDDDDVSSPSLKHQ